MGNKAKGNIALLITAIVWGSGFIAQKFGNNLLPPLTFNAVRQIFAAVFLLPILVIDLKKTNYLSKSINTAEVIKSRRKNSMIGGVVCGIFMLGGSVMQQVGLLTVSAGKSGFITALYIVFTPIFSIVLGGKIGARKFVCVFVALAGFAFLSLRGGLGGATIGDWLTLIGALFFAAQIVAVSYYQDESNGIIISVLQMAFCGIVGITIALIAEDATIAEVIRCMPVILYSAIFPTAVGFTLQIVGQKYADSTTSALIMSTESVFAALFGVLILSERMAPPEILGCLLIFAAVVLDQIEFKK